MDIYTFLENIEPQCFVGVDAVTFTAKEPLSMIGMRALLSEILPKVETSEQKQFNFLGAKGFSQGFVRYASKLDRFGKAVWAIAMVTGPNAVDVVKWHALTLKATRIDFRVDVVMSQHCPNLAERLFQITDRRGRFIASLVGQTFYPSENRENTYYGRIYDKSSEYGEELGKVWRWEIEVKRQAADSIIQTLLDCHDMEEFIESTTFGVFSEKWGVPTPKPGMTPAINYVAIAAISPEQKLEWIRRNVAKSVQHLKRVGYTAELEEMFRI